MYLGVIGATEAPTLLLRIISGFFAVLGLVVGLVFVIGQPL